MMSCLSSSVVALGIYKLLVAHSCLGMEDLVLMFEIAIVKLSDHTVRLQHENQATLLEEAGNLDMALEELTKQDVKMVS